MILILAFLSNWLLSYMITWLYCGWLWLVSGDVMFFGWQKHWTGLPVAHFVLISRYSWFAKLWQKWAGHAFLGAVITNVSEVGMDRVMRHEMRHVTQHLLLGALFYPAYAAAYVWAAVTTGRGYWDNWFEVDARRAE